MLKVNTPYTIKSVLGIAAGKGKGSWMLEFRNIK